MMEGGCLRVYQYPNRPFTTYVNGTYGGLMIAFIELFAKKYNYCYRMVRLAAPAGTDGKMSLLSALISNMSGNGVDIILGPLLMNDDRTKHVDYSIPLFHFEHRILYPRPELGPDLTGFVKPFTYDVWMMTGLAVLLITLPLFILPKLMLGSGSRRRRGQPNSIPSPVDPLIWLMGFAFAQAPKWPSSTKFAKYIALMWCLTTFIVTTVYRSNLKAMLTLPKVSVPFNNVEEMENQNEVRFSTIDKTILIHFLSKSDPDSLFGRIYSRLFLPKSGDQKTRADWILREKVAYLGPDIYLKGLMQTLYLKNKKCDLAVAREPFLTLFFGGVAIRKETPLKAQLDSFIQNLLEFGILNQWLAEAIGEAGRCFTPPTSEMIHELRPLSVHDFQGVFALFAGGILLACVVFLGEIIAGRGRKHN